MTEYTSRHSGWRDHATYLTERTPLSERQAEVLALKKTRHTTDEISDILHLPVETIEDHWTDILDQRDQARELCTVIGPVAWDGNETRPADELDDRPWSLLSSAAMTYADAERTRVELELYHGEHRVSSHSYLLIEREIVDSEDYATTTSEHRSAHGPNGLRGYIHHDTDTLDEFYVRDELLAKAGIDPGAKGAPPSPRRDEDVSEEEIEAAKDRAQERVQTHYLE